MTIRKIFEKIKNPLLIILIVLMAFIFSFLLNENDIVEILSHLPDILGILLAGVLASLAILFGLLSDTDLSRIRRRNIDRIRVENCDDHFLKFLTSIKNDTIIIFSSFAITYILGLLVHMDFSKINPSLNSQILNLPINLNVIFLTIGLTLFFLSISSTRDIIVSVFLLNRERYMSSTENE